jgi:NADPH:quinone reductase-like Zn-dependent oxidoreductase
MIYGLNKLRPDIGGFAEDVGATTDLLLKIRDHISFEEAATLGMDVSTAVLALFVGLQVPVTLEQLSAAKRDAQTDARPFVPVAGGSTATDTRTIQLPKL